MCLVLHCHNRYEILGVNDKGNHLYLHDDRRGAIQGYISYLQLELTEKIDDNCYASDGREFWLHDYTHDEDKYEN